MEQIIDAVANGCKAILSPIWANQELSADEKLAEVEDLLEIAFYTFTSPDNVTEEESNYAMKKYMILHKASEKLHMLYSNVHGDDVTEVLNRLVDLKRQGINLILGETPRA